MASGIAAGSCASKRSLAETRKWRGEVKKENNRLTSGLVFLYDRAWSGPLQPGGWQINKILFWRKLFLIILIKITNYQLYTKIKYPFILEKGVNTCLLIMFRGKCVIPKKYLSIYKDFLNYQDQSLTK